MKGMIHRCKGNRISSSPKSGNFEKSLGHCIKGFKMEPDESKEIFLKIDFSLSQTKRRQGQTVTQ